MALSMQRGPRSRICVRGFRKDPLGITAFAVLLGILVRNISSGIGFHRQVPMAFGYSGHHTKLEKQPVTSHVDRRSLLSGIVATSIYGVAGAVPPLIGVGQPARAEKAWQLQLPRTWQVFSQSDQPAAGDNRPVALIVAGDNKKGGELVVLRVPLQTKSGDNAVTARELFDYFSTPADKKPKVTQQQVIDEIAKSQKSQPGLTQFSLTGVPTEKVKSGRRYLQYEFDSSICPGEVVKGVKGDRCVQPDSEDEVPFLKRHHLITVTVSTPDTGDELPLLWLVDVSGPSDSWSAVKDNADVMSLSFQVANEELLEKERQAELAKLNEDLQKLQAAQEKQAATA